MHHPSNRPALPDLDTPSETAPAELPWHVEVGRLLSAAAELCVQRGLDLDSFMKGAWSAYVESRPGMRERLEELQLREQLDELRKRGRLAIA